MSGTFKSLILLSIIAVTVFGKDEPQTQGPRTVRRIIPADVLRDFPGVCFASTLCSTVEPGDSWELTPFCGRSTCLRTEAAEGKGLYYFYEVVEDCGPLPKPNDKCKMSDKTNKTAPFPHCCPVFECEPGVKLEYPEIPTVAPGTQNVENATTQNRI